MVKKTENPRYEQLDLFRPRPNRLRWRDLPERARKDVCRLLAQMFLDVVADGPEDLGIEEESHE